MPTDEAKKEEPKKEEPKKEEPKITPQQIEDGVLAFRCAAAVKLERLQAILDAAVLGAEQVQDKRLEILEKSPEVSVDEALFNVFVSFCLESNMAGWVFTKITRKVVGAILKSNTIYQMFPGSVDRQEVAKRIQQIRLNWGRYGQKVTKDDVSSLDIKSPDYLRYRRYLARLARGSQEETMVAVSKTAWEASKQDVKAAARDPLAATDSAGVSVLAAAQNYISQQRIALTIETNFYEFLARSSLMEADELKDLTAILNPDDLGSELSALRDKLKLVFEAMIWSRLYEFHKRTMQTSLLADLLNGDPRNGIEGISNEALVNYWKRRFGKLIVEWTQAYPGYFKFWGKYPIQSYEYLDSAETQLEYLLIFFKFFPDKMPDITTAIQTGYREKKT